MADNKYAALVERLRDGTGLPVLQALMTEAADAIEALEEEHAADVRENKERYWYEDEAGCAICSECRKYAFETSTHHISGWFPPFCPNCGADMREES